MNDWLNENFLRVNPENNNNSNESPLRIKKREARWQIFIERLWMYISPDIEKNLENLRWLIDENLFKQFEQRIASILEQNPWSEAIIAQETEKVWIWAQIAINNYKDLLYKTVKWGANDDFQMPTQRTYWWRWTPQIEQQDVA
jgi:hypothetical protein